VGKFEGIWRIFSMAPWGKIQRQSAKKPPKILKENPIHSTPLFGDKITDTLKISPESFHRIIVFENFPSHFLHFSPLFQKQDVGEHVSYFTGF
jgi:hypothetical protein